VSKQAFTIDCNNQARQYNSVVWYPRMRSALEPMI